MKKLLATVTALLAVTLPFSAMTVSAEDTPAVQAQTAEKSAVISADTVSSEVGGDIAVALTMSNNPGVVAVGFNISYDTESLELVSVDDSNLFADAIFTPGGDITAVPYNLTWEDGTAHINYKDNGELAVLHFHVLDTAVSGLSEIEITADEENTFDVDLNSVHFDSVSGGVEIESSATTGTTTATTTEATTTTATVAETTTTATPDEITTTATVAETTTTATATSSSAEITTTATTTTATAEAKYSADEIRDMSVKDYKDKTGVEPANAEATANADGTVTVEMTDKDGKVLDTYTIDSETGKGTNSAGEEVDLPQTGIASAKTAIAVAGAVALTVTGAVFIYVSRKNRENETE